MGKPDQPDMIEPKETPTDKRGRSTVHGAAKWKDGANKGTLGMNSGGDETANLNEDSKVKYNAQKRYKMELQAQIDNLRAKYPTEVTDLKADRNITAQVQRANAPTPVETEVSSRNRKVTAETHEKPQNQVLSPQ